MISSAAEIKSFNTAKSSLNLSAPTRIALEKGFLEEVILDWGCGRGRDTNWLNKQGIKTIGFDPYFAPLELKTLDFAQIRTIIVIYILNVISNPNERNVLIDQIQHYALPGTKIIFAARSGKHINRLSKKMNWLPFNDGYVTRKKTFQKGYSLKELIDMTNNIGDVLEFIENHTFVFLMLVKR